jgi:hypothetical protein
MNRNQNQNRNDNRAPQAPLRSGWAGNKTPINNGCVRILKGESRFKSLDKNFARTVNDKSPVQLAKQACRDRKEKYLKRATELKALSKGYKKEGDVWVKGFHKIPV